MNLPVAIFTDKYAEYQRVFVESISDRLSDHRMGTLCFEGRELSDPASVSLPHSPANSIYQLANEQSISGIIFLSGTLGFAVTPKRLTSFASQFSVPRVSLGMRIPEIASVVVEDSAGMWDLMDHLLVDPERRNFAFIRGYATDTYSMAREDIFVRALERRGIPTEAISFVYGNYDDAVVFNAVTKLLTDRPSIDTLVAANDLMALSAVRAVVASGRSIPADVVVTGFDDTFDSIRSYPTITTVRQPLQEMGRISADLLLKQINGSPTNEFVEVRSTLAVRESSSFRPTSRHGKIANTASLLEVLESAVGDKKSNNSVSIADIYNLLWAATDDQNDSLLRHCSAYLSKPMSQRDLHWWLELCFQIEHQCLPLLEGSGRGAGVKVILDQLHRIRQQLWGISSGHDADARRTQGVMSDFMLQLATVTKPEYVTRIVRELVVELNMSEFFMVVYPNSEVEATQAACLEIEFSADDPKSNLNVESREVLFPASNLLPEHVQSKIQMGGWLLSPIFAHQRLLGYIVFKIGLDDTINFREIALTIGGALHNCYLMRELAGATNALQAANHDLMTMAATDSLTGLPNRNKFNTDLQNVFEGFQKGVCGAALLFIDLDGFKAVNDTLGHSAGDELLQVLAQRMTFLVDLDFSDSSQVYRLGGDEFTIILRFSSEEVDISDSERLQNIASQLLESLSTPVSLGQNTASLTGSIGIARLTDVMHSEDLWLKKADLAMYEAKTTGKNQMRMSDPNDQIPRKAA